MAGYDQISKSLEPKVLRKRKTKFEKYLELDKHNRIASAEEDLALERKLAKKLKVKKGKLRGDDDEINMLFDGISSIFDSLETENTHMEEASEGTVKKVESRKKYKKSKKKVDAEIRSDDMIQGHEPEPEPEMTINAELDFESNQPQASAVEGNGKYIPPHLRSISRNEAEEYSQIRKRVRGLLNRLSESNVEGIAGEMATTFQSIARSVGAQIMGEEILASCSGGPRGNEQLSPTILPFKFYFIAFIFHNYNYKRHLKDSSVGFM